MTDGVASSVASFFDVCGAVAGSRLRAVDLFCSALARMGGASFATEVRATMACRASGPLTPIANAPIALANSPPAPAAAAVPAPAPKRMSTDTSHTGKPTG